MYIQLDKYFVDYILCKNIWRISHMLQFVPKKIPPKRPRSNSSSSSLYKRRTDRSAGDRALALSASKRAGRASEGRDQVSGSASAIGGAQFEGCPWGK